MQSQGLYWRCQLANEPSQTNSSRTWPAHGQCVRRPDPSVCACLLLISLTAVPVEGAEPEDVTLVQLIANPEKFDGKLIRVIGFSYVSNFEETCSISTAKITNMQSWGMAYGSKRPK